MKEQNLCKKAKLIIFFKKFFPGTTLSEGGTNLPFRGGLQKKDKTFIYIVLGKTENQGMMQFILKARELNVQLFRKSFEILFQIFRMFKLL